MVKALLDTNILIDYLNGLGQAAEEINRFDDAAISVVSWIEVLAGANAKDETDLRAFLSRFTLIGLDPPIAEGAARLKRKHRIKLPDAVIWASARTSGRLFVTRDSKDFPPDDPGVRVPYKI